MNMDETSIICLSIKDDSERPITSDDLSELSYLSCVVKESLRILPSVPGVSRDLDEDTIVSEYKHGDY